MITTTVKELKAILSVLGKNAGKNKLLPILSFIRMVADPETNLITFTATDLHAWEHVSIKADVTSSLDCLLDFKLLKAALSYAIGIAFFTWQDEDSYLEFETANMKMAFLTENSDNFPKEHNNGSN